MYNDFDYSVMHDSSYDVMAEFSSTTTYDYDGTTSETADFFLGFGRREEERRRRNFALGAALAGAGALGAGYLFRDRIGNAINRGLQHVGRQIGQGLGMDEMRALARENAIANAVMISGDPALAKSYVNSWVNLVPEAFQRKEGDVVKSIQRYHLKDGRLGIGAPPVDNTLDVFTP